MMATLLAVALVAYVLGILLAIAVTVFRSAVARSSASLAFGAGCALHLAAIVARGREGGGLPLTNLGEFLLLLGFAVMVLNLWIWFRWRADIVGLLLPPLAAVAGASAWALLSNPSRPSTGSPTMFYFHTSVSTLGLAVLIVALVMSVIFLFQDRALKSRRTLTILERLPPLHRCEQIAFHALVGGFVLFSLGIFTGGIVSWLDKQTLWTGGPKQVFPLVAWAIFAAVLAGRAYSGFRGRRSAYWTIAGVAVGLLTVVGITI